MKPVDIALDLALIVMENGGSTNMVDQTFQNVLKGCNKDEVFAIWRMDLVIVSNPAEGESSTIVRPIGTIRINLARVSEAAVLGERVARGEVDIAAIAAEVDRIKKMACPYNRWLLIIAAACNAVCFSLLLGWDWGCIGIVFLAAGAGQFLRSLLQARNLAVSNVTLICGVLSACMAGLGLRLGVSQMVPATLIASVIYLVPGLPLINGFFDLVSHKYLIIGIERLINAAFLFLVLAVDIAFAYTVVM